MKILKEIKNLELRIKNFKYNSFNHFNLIKNIIYSIFNILNFCKKNLILNSTFLILNFFKLLFNPLHISQKRLYKSLKQAFSLIELSIVLIIIGLLVAGVTGGASLIESARIRNFASEIESYRTAIYAFKAAKDKLPGDIDNNGIIGRYKSGSSKIDEQTSNTFPGEYSGINITWRPGPFVDLYMEGLIDFKPFNGTGHTLSSDGQNSEKDVPISKAFKNIKYNGFYSYNNYSSSSTTNFEYNILDGIHFWIVAYKDSINPKIVKKIDEKIDDGSYIEGVFRFNCGNVIYDIAIANNTKCTEGEIKLIDL